jgi:hydrogenase nickel incorporation protein HypB
MFQQSAALVINKIDLLPYTKVDINKMRNDSLALNPKLKVFEVSCSNDTGIDAWAQWLNGLRSQ